MSSTIDTIRELIKSQRGDHGRLSHILKSIERGKPLYISDQKYLDKILSEYNDEIKLTHSTDNNITPPPSTDNNITPPPSTDNNITPPPSTDNNVTQEQNESNNPKSGRKVSAIFTILGIVGMVLMAGFVIGMAVYVIPIVDEKEKNILPSTPQQTIPNLDAIVSRGIDYCSQNKDETCDQIMLQWYAECNGELKDYNLPSCKDGRISIYLVTRGLSG